MPPHPLLRGTRWRLARPQSRALWTAASPRELAELFDDATLRSRAEAFLHLVTRSVDDVEALLFFDLEAQELALALSLPRPTAAPTWDWIASGHVGVQPRDTPPYLRQPESRARSADPRP